MRGKYRFGRLIITLMIMGSGSAALASGDVIREAADRCFKVKEMTPGYTGKFTWTMFTDKRKLSEFPALKDLCKQYSSDHQVEVISFIAPGGSAKLKV